jgi:hypothetical protein
MRTASRLLGSALLLFGALIAYSLLYDATDLTRQLGLDPAGAEAIVALVGLGLALSAIGVGFRLVRRVAPALPAR